ncbi:MAG TPA: TlyA family RNA methyltransferase [Verrucomicrobiae bacterium]|nr:TlyA family RNA methyltransferase [Verrucomicrobiae bacterium]
MTKSRLDHALVARGLVPTRSQAESYIRLGKVVVNKKIITKPGTMVYDEDVMRLTTKEQYVSRAGLKLSSVSKALGLDFRDKVVLDVGSSTGGFTDYALQHGARKVIAIEVGTDQLHHTLRGDDRIELHEKTDIRDVRELSDAPDVVVIDVSFISLRDILPTVAALGTNKTEVIAMVKPQFEATESSLKHKGVIKNDAMRRKILQDFETWAKSVFVITNKADSEVAGEKGNKERFYLLKKSR